ncbi:MAG TPA: DUF2007 domain-containing protein [Caulobacteraceae bacterium]|jgi:hypothetical protein|nr:DUF2007 domain-containing protein [Caulobacteraceae bacterium]
MGVAYVGYYAMSSEAWVVRGALRSAGIPADVFDPYRSSIIWTEQTMLGGFRVAVPTDDLDDALAILKEIAPKPQPIEDKGWTIGAMLVAFLCFGFSMSLWGYPRARARPTPWRMGAFVTLFGIEALAWTTLLLMMTHRPRF